MKILLRLLLAVVALAAGICLWRFLFPSPESVIRERLNQVAVCASFAANEGDLARVLNTEKLGGFFAPDVRIVFEGRNGARHQVEGRNEIVRGALGLRQITSSLQVKFLDIHVVLGPAKQTAEVELTGLASTPEEKDYFVQEMRVYLRKVSGDWLIVKIETVKTLS
jgi:hypothetical protein